MRYGTKWPTYAEQWDAMAINPAREAEFRRYAQFAIAHKAEYLEIEKATGVSWPHVAVLHRRESDSDFNTYLGNGEPLNRVTRLVPKGRGPFSSFLAGAIDAFGVDGLDKVIDWRLEKILYYCEIFNGLGYEGKGLPSPYIWGGTNQQKSGKYVSDGVFDPNVMDTQPGCAPILLMIAKLDPSVKFVRETPMGVEPPTTPEPPMAETSTTDALLRQLIEQVAALSRVIQFDREPDNPKQPDPDIVLPPVVITPPAGPIAGTLQSKSMQLTSIAGVAIWALQALGVLPAGIGQSATEAGAVLSAAPLGSAAISLTGGWGGIAQLGLSLLSGLAGRKTQ
jgi:lysozyme family protein